MLRIKPVIKRQGIHSISVLALLALIGCSANAPSAISSKGRQLCLERSAQVEPGTPVEQQRQVYRSCLKTIEAELSQQQASAAAQRKEQLQQQQSQAAKERASWASPQERLISCRMHRDAIAAAQRELLRRREPVMTLTKQYGDSSPQALAADAQYQEQVAVLDRLIPASMRHGLPLIPDAVDLFLRCDPGELDAR